MTNYSIEPTKRFRASYKKIVRKDKKMSKRIQKVVDLLQFNPYYPSLKTHKVQTRSYGERYSSWITGDTRLIWDYDENNRLILLLLDIGGHSGKNRVYN